MPSLASRSEMESGGNREASGLRSNHESFTPSSNRHDMVTEVKTNLHRRNRHHGATTIGQLQQL